ncbi:MAG: M23 family metallopeptidase, partial [Propionibacteriaceae bacterium]|nr:M23 family metallopeptidase [Propionibacteriaceae bacterium]
MLRVSDGSTPKRALRAPGHLVRTAPRRALPAPDAPRSPRHPARAVASLALCGALTIPFAGSLPVPADPGPSGGVIGDLPATPLTSTAGSLWSQEQNSRSGREWLSFGSAADEAMPRASGVGVQTPDPTANPADPTAVDGLSVGTAEDLASPYVSPVPGPITSPFGPRMHPILRYVRNHNGVDMTASCGTPVVAMSDGRVTRSAMAGGYGLLVELNHGTVDEDRLSSRYAHLSVLGVRVGQQVTKGQQIGLAGTTGLSTGCHLHFEVLMNGSYVDPAAVLSGAPHVRLTTPIVPWTPPPTAEVPTTTPKDPFPDLPALPDPTPTPKPPVDPTSPAPSPDPVTPSPTPPVDSPSPRPIPSQPPTAGPAPDPKPAPDPTDPTPRPIITPPPASSPEPSPKPADPAPEPKPEPAPKPDP